MKRVLFLITFLSSASTLAGDISSRTVWVESYQCQGNNFSAVYRGTHGFYVTAAYETFRKKLKSSTGEFVYPMRGAPWTSKAFKGIDFKDLDWLSFVNSASLPDFASVASFEFDFSPLRPNSIIRHDSKDLDPQPAFPTPDKDQKYFRNKFSIKYRHNEIWDFELNSFDGQYKYSFDNLDHKYDESVHKIAARLRSFDKYALKILACCQKKMSQNTCLRLMR